MMQLPSPICTYQELNYTLFISDVNGSDDLSIGPFHRFGSGLVTHELTPELMPGEEYSVRVMLETAFNTLQSYNHIFGKNVKVFMYM